MEKNIKQKEEMSGFEKAIAETTAGPARTEKLRFKVLGSKILIDPIELSNKIEGTDLLVPEQILKKERIIEGIVVKVGPDVKEVKVGERVLYERYTAAEIKLDGLDHHIVGNEAQLHGVFEN